VPAPDPKGSQRIKPCYERSERGFFKASELSYETDEVSIELSHCDYLHEFGVETYPLQGMRFGVSSNTIMVMTMARTASLKAASRMRSWLKGLVQDARLQASVR